MKGIIALVISRSKEFYRDRATLSWSLVFPIVVLMLFTYGYGTKSEPILRITVAMESSALELPWAAALRIIPGVTLTSTPDSAVAYKKLQRYETDLVIEIPQANPDQNKIAYTLIPESDRGRLAERILIDSTARLSLVHYQLESKSMVGRKIRYAEWLVPGLIAMNVMFGSLFGVGYVIVRYRKNGVLKRLRATPVTAAQFLLSQVISRILMMLVTGYLILWGAMLLIGFKPQGSLLHFGLYLTMSSAAMISIGLIVASRLSSEEVADGVLNLLTWPMIFLSGIWFSLEGSNPWLLMGADFLPLTHVVSGLRAILIDGTSMSALLPQIGILAVMTAVFISIGSMLFKWR